ncbi:MAG: hypothetical protein AAF351_15645 [Pseudomonadota bacterium]
MNDLAYITKLPVLDAVRETFREVGQKWPALFLALLIPAISLIVAEHFQSQLPTTLVNSIVFTCILLPINALFAIVCHRIIILGPDSLPRAIGVFWTGRETRFVGWQIAMIILGIALSVVLIPFFLLVRSQAAMDVLIPTVLLPVVLYLSSRVLMVFPAAATDQKTSIQDSWELTRDNGWRVVAATSIPMLPLGIPVFSFLQWGPEELSFGAWIVFDVLLYVISAISICAISVTYRMLANPTNDEEWE